jgi:hypothetical protein
MGAIAKIVAAKGPVTAAAPSSGTPQSHCRRRRTVVVRPKLRGDTRISACAAVGRYAPGGRQGLPHRSSVRFRTDMALTRRSALLGERELAAMSTPPGKTTKPKAAAAGLQARGSRAASGISPRSEVSAAERMLTLQRTIGNQVMLRMSLPSAPGPWGRRIRRPQRSRSRRDCREWNVGCGIAREVLRSPGQPLDPGNWFAHGEPLRPRLQHSAHTRGRAGRRKLRGRWRPPHLRWAGTSCSAPLNTRPPRRPAASFWRTNWLTLFSAQRDVRVARGGI